MLAVAGPTMLNRMAKWAIGLSIAALLAAIGSAFYHGTVRFEGAASGWVSGIGSLSGALVALGIALYSDRKDRRDRRARLTESHDKASAPGETGHSVVQQPERPRHSPALWGWGQHPQRKWFAVV